MMRNIIGQTKSAFNLRNVMDDGKILLVNLSRGRTGDLNSKLLGMIFVMKFEAAAMSRADVPEEYRRDFCLYVDEFQNFSTDSFADILSQARKYHLNLIVANQFTTQLSEEIRDAVFGNVGSVITFRVGTNDSEFLAKQYAPVFDTDDLQFLPNFNTAVRMMIGGVPVQPFSMATMPQLGHPNPQLAEALKQLSSAKYGRPKATVADEIFKRLETQAVAPAGPPRPEGSFGSGFPAPVSPMARTSTAPVNPTAPKPQQSFLDEWLAKRKANLPVASSATPTVPPRIAVPSQPAAAPTENDLALPIAPPAIPVTAESSDREGEFKINRGDDAGSQDGEVQTVRIDKDGNLSY